MWFWTNIVVVVVIAFGSRIRLAENWYFEVSSTFSTSSSSSFGSLVTGLVFRNCLPRWLPGIDFLLNLKREWDELWCFRMESGYEATPLQSPTWSDCGKFTVLVAGMDLEVWQNSDFELLFYSKVNNAAKQWLQIYQGINNSNFYYENN